MLIVKSYYRLKLYQKMTLPMGTSNTGKNFFVIFFDIRKNRQKNLYRIFQMFHPKEKASYVGWKHRVKRTTFAILWKRNFREEWKCIGSRNRLPSNRRENREQPACLSIETFTFTSRASPRLPIDFNPRDWYCARQLINWSHGANPLI